MASAILGGPRRMKEINKEEFKKEVEDYVKILLLTSGWQRTRHTKRRMSRQYTICLWSF